MVGVWDRRTGGGEWDGRRGGMGWEEGERSGMGGGEEGGGMGGEEEGSGMGEGEEGSWMGKGGRGEGQEVTESNQTCSGDKCTRSLRSARKEMKAGGTEMDGVVAGIPSGIVLVRPEMKSTFISSVVLS